MSGSTRQAEEVANTVTHGIGVVLSVAALAVLVTFASLKGDAWRVVGLSIYGATLFLLYLASTLYHSFRGPRLKRIFHRLDHCAIFLLIAGTYTPVTLVHLRGPWGWSLFGVIWGLAVIGTVLKIFLTGRFRIVSTLIYLAMGWMVLVAIRPVLQNVPPGFLLWLVIGGASYTLGVIFFIAKRLPYHHAIWHLFVLGGSISHFFGMLFHVVPSG